jgi:hypothetical protein
VVDHEEKAEARGGQGRVAPPTSFIPALASCLKKYRPKVVILENLFKDARYVAFMRTFGYVLWRHLEPNDVYVRSDLRRLMPTRKLGDIADEFIKRLYGSALMRRLGRLYRLISLPLSSSVRDASIRKQR